MNGAQRKSAPLPERFCERIAEVCCANTGDNIKPACGGQNQPFGSMPRFRNSERPNSFSQLLVLVFSSIARSSNCLRSSAGMRIGSIGDFPPPLGCLSRVIDMHMPIGLLLTQIGIYTNMCKPIKTTPRTGGTVPGRLTTNVNASNEAAMKNHTQTHSKFQYRFRFLALCATGSAIIHITAPDEHAAREMSPAGFVMVFTARLPAEVHHA